MPATAMGEVDGCRNRTPCRWIPRTDPIELRLMAISKINNVDCVRLSRLNWELHILVEIAVINEAWFIQAIPWSGTFHHARSLVRKRQQLLDQFSNGHCALPKGNACPSLPPAR